MDPKKLNSYVGVVNQPPPKWSSVKKWLLHINYAPGYAPEPEQKPVCRQFSRCEGCPYGLFRRKDNGQLPVFQREPQAMDSPQMGGM